MARDVQIHSSWKTALAGEFTKPYWETLTDFVREEYEQYSVYPEPKEVFYALDVCPFEKVKVVVVGQDPYHGAGQAHGLAFSVRQGVAVPPSLQNIYKELETDLGISRAQQGNLSSWAEQGVLLLNATLTVRAHTPGSHQKKGWETFTDAVLSALSLEREHLVFLLWGRYAQEKAVLLDSTKHCILTAPHPSPFSAHAGFFGCKHFSKANTYLSEKGVEPIRWELP